MARENGALQSAAETTVGQLLANPNEFFHSFNHFLASTVVLHAAADAAICERLADGPVRLEDLAARCDLPADKLARLVDYLAAEEILDRLPDGRVAALPSARHVRSIASAVECGLIYFAAARHILSALRQSRTPYEVCYGKPVFEHLANEPKTAAMFADFMGYLTRRVESFVLSQHTFEPFETVCDVGGNHGALLLKVLELHPGANGILFDLPEVVAQAGTKLAASPEGERVAVVGGSFFEAAPAADLYLLKMILHDWADHECVEILRTVRAAIGPGGRVAVVDLIVPEEPTPCEALDFDIGMMVWDTGKERKLSEFEALFEASGFRLDRVSENPHGQSVIEAVPV